ncbi:MAG: glycoside hydrolase family 65 protein [Solirubrobacterales bacterium]|nr:glycoside hydrolase family 65 protein [Solirubrobacterales bacterium]MBV9372763.1 glycoside hydrolase family 65 protein [Alphaproteobacteria bacterium]
MIRHPAFPVEPWAVRESELQLDSLARTESLFALANGHIGLRANLDEGEPHGLPGSYLGGFYELRPLPSPESVYSNPESGQTVVNVTNGKIIRLLVDDEPFDVRYGELRRHERVLDLRAGVLRRTAEWLSPTERLVRVSSTRLVSFTQRAVAAVLYEVEPLDGPLSVVVQSELVTNESLPEAKGDPREAAGLRSPLVSEYHASERLEAILVHSTPNSRLRMGAIMDHVLDGPDGMEATVESFPDVARLTMTADLTPDAPLRMVKFIAYGWSRERSLPAIRDQVAAAAAGARHAGWQGLVDEQRAYLERFWERADVEIDGDEELQQAIRFSMFHVLQAGARGEQRAIAAKGLTGPGYDGHAFWDTETFVLPMLTYTAPRAVGDALRWRHRTLPLARERAATLGLRGAAFPWRTIHGQECSGYWPAGTAAFHINADIADAVVRYFAATDDVEFDRKVGVEILVETARLWRSLGHHDASGRFRIDGVTGPDEYSAVADNNLFTNLMAQRNLRAAAAAVERHADRAAELGVDEEESASWRDAAEAMLIPYDHMLEVHAQADGFTEHQVWDFKATTAEQYPLLLHYPYFDLYRKQVVKQADLVLAMHLRGDAFTPEEKERNFAYYERLTVRDSSLSACTQAVLAAEVGHLELAYDYFGEAGLMDLDDLEKNTRDGLHIASLAGTWIAAVAGLGGMRDHDGELSFAPRLPQALSRLAFRLVFRRRRLLVEVDRDQARYSLVRGDPIEITHHGERVTVGREQAVTLAVPPATNRSAPEQPAGREPVRRRTGPAPS